MRMLSLILGEDALQRALSQYLRERQFDTSSDVRLWELLEMEADSGILPENVTLAEIMQTWTNLRGFPVVTVRRNYNTSEVTISQVKTLNYCGCTNVSTFMYFKLYLLF